jgi:serine/threonine protein kinase/Tol biopolymer transport system component
LTTGAAATYYFGEETTPMVGQTLAHYSIIEKLGEGGMGAVYKARDTRLDRFVALKILPAERMADLDRRRRFIQEAKAASALNHPNIVTIYDIGEAESVHFIAMEYVEGRTLDGLIGKKGLPIAEALGLAVQIADGLGKAHGAGIIHRDLKPANIMVTGDGLVKILDFGLAKLVETAAPGGGEGAGAGKDGLRQGGPPGATGATMTMPQTPATEEGLILGTVAYMSPEQASGKPVDARSDIFSFGSVLYEMLTGERAFDGETKASTLAAVIALDPKPPSAARGALPREVERVVMRCLRKDTQRRWQNMTDLKVALQDLKEESDSGTLMAAGVAPQLEARSRRRTWLAASLAAFVVLIAGAIVVWRLLRPAPGLAAAQPERITFEPGFTFWPAISPDGKMIAYSSERDGNFDIYVRQFSGKQAIRRTDHPAADWYANFSPDGSKIVFRSERDGGGLYLMESLGGPERKIADEGTLPAFSPDGSTITYVVGNPLTRLGKLFIVSAAGGVPRPLAGEFVLLARGTSWSSPLWSADGQSVFIDGMRLGDQASRGWWLAPVDGGPPVSIKSPVGPARFVRVVTAWWDGHVYYSEGSTIGGMTLFRVPLSLGSRPEAGPPQLVTSPAGMQWGASISSDGRMVYSTMTPSINVWSVPLKPGDGTAAGPPEHVTSDALGKFGVCVSADGSRLAWLAYSPEQFELRLRDIASGREESIPCTGETLAIFPRLSPDGSRLAYSDVVDGKRVDFIAERGSAPRRWDGRGVIIGFSSKTRDVFTTAGDQVFRSDEAGNLRNTILDTTGRGDLFDTALSPTGERVAFTIARPDGSAALYAARVGNGPAAADTWTNVAEGRLYIGSPSWSFDGRTLFYGSNRDGFYCIWAQRFAADGKLDGEPFAAFHNHRPPDTMMYRISFMSAARDRLYMLLAEVKGDLWSLQLRK